MSAKALLEEAKRLASPKTQKTEDNQKIADSDKTALPGRSIKKGSRSERFHRSKEALKGETYIERYPRFTLADLVFWILLSHRWKNAPNTSID